MGITVGVGLDVDERFSLISPGGETPHFITIERRWERVDGGALVALAAHTGDPDQPIVQWDNPFRPSAQGHGAQWHDDEIWRGRLPVFTSGGGPQWDRTNVWRLSRKAGPGINPGFADVFTGRRTARQVAARPERADDLNIIASLREAIPNI